MATRRGLGIGRARPPATQASRTRASRNQGLREHKYNALVARALEIGDQTFAPPPPAVPIPTGFTPFVALTPAAASFGSAASATQEAKESTGA
jgi:hypothetical protein